MRSVFLWRVLFLLMITVLLASIIMTAGYVYFSRGTYTSIRLKELVPEAQALGQIYVEHSEGLLDRAAFLRLTQKLMEAAGALCLISDADGAAVYQSDEFFSSVEPYYHEKIHNRLQSALNGQTSEESSIPMQGQGHALSVCTPIQNNEGETIGAVFLLQSQAQVVVITRALSRPLILIAAFVVPAMLMLSSVGMRVMTDPLRRMSDVALKMSGGDFKIRADESQIGEVGLMARALNNLCETLTNAIYQLRAEKSQLKHILASLSEGVAATDRTGAITIYNPALMHMFGAVRVITREDLVPDNAVWRSFDEVYATGEPAELRFSTASGRALWVTLTPILTDDGERAGVVGLFKDMTELESQEQARRDYIQNISHELRTPLTAVRGLLEPLADGMVNDEADRQRYYKIMLREVVRLSRLITDMMELSRIQSGSEYMEPKKTDILEVLEEVCESYGKEAQEHGISLVLDAKKLPYVLTDPDRVEQILIILISNAMRYTPKGGTITIKGEDGPRVNISVIDTGCGMKPEDLPRIFDRFYTADKSRKEGTTGLGLSIAREIIDRLDESIAVKSEPGKGSCFCFTLKKYVSNAIALGPAKDEWAQNQHVSFFDEDSDAPPPVDAPYVVISSKKQKQNQKKKQKPHDQA